MERETFTMLITMLGTLGGLIVGGVIAIVAMRVRGRHD